ncbi:MAG: adenylate/guanylate cyclase domain-containing protein, partial [Syntrophales bacterium]|nr:adenylate/guanylate cyclase domain-containing protein [Syntrophales bacterium]
PPPPAAIYQSNTTAKGRSLAQGGQFWVITNPVCWSVLGYHNYLVADLQDSCRICTELPPEEYFKVVNDMWKTLEGTFRKYYGIYGKHAGDGMVYYFLKESDNNYLVNALSCALEIKEMMTEFSQKWKVRKKWFNDLYLNIGLNEGDEYFSTIRGSTGIEFTALGDTINSASRLSSLARFGSIFATKNLINKMTEKDRKRFRTGIRKTSHEGQVFIENIYSRVMDLLDGDHREQGKLMDIGVLPVTEVAGRIDYDS